jgi:hypothetical protein
MRPARSNGEDEFIDLALRVLRERGVEVARSDLGRVYDALASTQDSEQGPMLARFRDWLGDHIWTEDDMGGFLQCGTALSWREEQAQMMANAAQLFDLLDPDWRSHTGRARRDG